MPARLLATVALIATFAVTAGCGSAASSSQTALSPAPGAGARSAPRPNTGHARRSTVHSRPTSSDPQLGHATKFSGCRVHGRLPDPACTPGSVFAAATVSQICTPGYARRARDVTEQTRLAVYAAYGIAPGQGARYELDHLVPLEVGGDNSQANLWPEIAPGYGEKDQVENELHDAVCSGSIALRTAQRRIARNWLRAGVSIPQSASIRGEEPPRRSPSVNAPARPAPGAGTAGNAAFCATHPCIASFDEGHGTIVQCADGEWSHSGGRPGACSRHGGVR